MLIICVRCSWNAPDGVEHEWVCDELARRGRACDQGTGAAGVAATELVGTCFGGREVRLELVEDAVDERRRCQFVDDDRAAGGHRRGDVVGVGSRGNVCERERRLHGLRLRGR
jgi:hypothetical protein